MTTLFYIAAVIAVLATVLVVTRTNLVHALLYLVVSLFAVAVVFYTLGAPFVAALEVIVYAGAIMMLFVFAVMLLNVSADSTLRVPWRAWIGPLLLVAVLLGELVYGIGLSNHALQRQPRSGPSRSATRSSDPTCSASSSPRCCCSPRSSARGTSPHSRTSLRTRGSRRTVAPAGGCRRRCHDLRRRPLRLRREDLMAAVTLDHGLILAAILFVIGFVGLITRRNLIVSLACIEIMLNAAGLAFVVAGARWGRADGQVMFLFVLAMAAAEVAVGLALAIRFRQSLGRLDVDDADEMKG